MNLTIDPYTSPLEILEFSIYRCMRSDVPDGIPFMVRMSNNVMKVVGNKNDEAILSFAFKSCFILKQLKRKRLILREANDL